MLKIISTIRFIVLLALAYALLGWIGLAAAIPPGYASPVFPAAGLALACILSFGRKALFGVWFGSFLLNLCHSTITPTVMAVAAVIACGATVQAWVGGWLVNRWQSPFWRELEREKDTLNFLFFGGILATGLSPSFGVSSMYVAGIIEKAEFFYTWWNWYVGDTLGVLIFAPLTMCLSIRHSALWRQRRRLIIFPMLLMISIASMACYMTARWEKQVQDNNLRADAEFIANRINDRLVTHRAVMSSLSHFIEATPDFTFQQFQHFTQMILNDNPDIFALSFNDLVTDDSRAAFEKRVSGQSPLGPYQITELNDHGDLVRAATRSEYVAVRYIVPLLTSKPAVGYDINSEPVRREAIGRARASKSMAVTGPIQLVQEQKKRIGLLELQPVAITLRGDSGVQGSNIIGFAVGVIKIDQMIEIAIGAHMPAGLVLQLTDMQTPGNQSLLYHSESHGIASITPRAGMWKTVLSMGDRDWELKLLTTSDYRKEHRPWMAWAVGVAGLMFVVLLQILLLGMTGRTAMVLRKNEEIQSMSKTLEEKVIARTADLKAALREKEILLREIHHRVKNNMQMISSLISLQSDRMKDDQMRQMFVESQQRINAMAMIHETLYESQNLAAIDFSDYVKRLVTHLQRAYGNNHKAVRVVLELAEVKLSIDLAVPCGLIINELLTNSFKHAFPHKDVGMIQVKIYQINENELELIVSDNGVGLPADLDWNNSFSLGLTLVKGLLEHQLRGRWKVMVEGGTTFALRWPLSD